MFLTGPDSMFVLLGLLLAALIALPIIALLRTARIGQLERRLEGVEAALRRMMREVESLRASGVASAETTAQRAAPEPPVEHVPEPRAPSSPEPLASAAFPGVESEQPAPSALQSPPAAPAPKGRSLEEVIGERWLGWIAVGLILFAAAFFLKYAFENRWIGEVGRVMIGVIVGLLFVWAGWRRHRAGWRQFAQVLTGGGITLVYLSTYASFGFYNLINQSSAFAFLVLVVIQGHLLAVAYNSRAVALMSQIGGFLVPILLSTGEDRYGVLFSYLAVLNAGVALVSFARRWTWIATFSFLATHAFFWAWHAAHYHPDKRGAALLFQGVVFALFLLADLAPQFRGRAATLEQWGRLLVNPFLFFAASYTMLEADYPDWMGAFALAMALLYALLARAGATAEGWDRRSLLVTIGVALTFVTLAIPIQLESDWITLGWGVQGAVLVWLSIRMRNAKPRPFAAIVFGLALFQHLANDTPWFSRQLFNPVWNRYFMGALTLVALLALAAYLCHEYAPAFSAGLTMAALALFWLAISVETYTYSDTLVAALPSADNPEGNWEQARQIRWFGQSVLSVLWSLYAAALVAAGFRWKWALLRWTGLLLFGLTLLKVVTIDMAELQQIYRIVAFLALGLLLLGVAWAYQRIARRERAG